MKEIAELGMAFLAVVVVGALLATLPTLWLWNSLVPTLFDLPTITFWQALGLVLLARCLIPTSSSK